MSRLTLAGNRRRRKLFTYLWIAALAIGTIVLIYREMTALLYILATLGVTALLVVVALSDLGRGENTSDNSNRIDDSAAIGSGITSTFGTKQS
jgi:hypothetical protein